MARVGLVAPIFQFWDRPSNRLVAEFDHAILAKDTRHPFVVQCEQFKTASLLLKGCRRLSNVEVLFNHEVIDVRQTSEIRRASMSADQTSIQSHTGAYLIGADGGRSTVRKRSEIAFDGFTWPERFIVLTTPFDFEAQRGYSYRSYFAEPGAWCNCFKVSADGPPGLWRTVFPTEPSEDDAAIMSDAGVQDRMQRFFPEPRSYEIVHRNLVRDASARSGDVPQRACAAGRRRRARQQSNRRDGTERRYSGCRKPGWQSWSAFSSAANPIARWISTTCNAEP